MHSHLLGISNSHTPPKASPYNAFCVIWAQGMFILSYIYCFICLLINYSHSPPKSNTHRPNWALGPQTATHHQKWVHMMCFVSFGLKVCLFYFIFTGLFIFWLSTATHCQNWIPITQIKPWHLKQPHITKKGPIQHILCCLGSRYVYFILYLLIYLFTN